MKTVEKRRGSLITAALAAGGVIALLLSGCSSTTSSGPKEGHSVSGSASGITVDSVDQAQLASTIRKAFLVDTPVSELNPLVADTLAVASVPLSAENEKLFAECMQQPTCDTGRGTLKIGIPIFATANAYNNVNRAEATAQLLAYPDVNKIYFSISNGDVASSIANVKSLITQGVDAIILDPSLGAALKSVLQEAKDAGILVIGVVTPASDDVRSALTMQVPIDLCATYENGVKALTDKVTAPSTYMLFSGIPGNDNAAAWQPCAKKALDAAGWTQLRDAFTNWTSQGEAQAANALRASGDKPGAILYDYSSDQLVRPFVDAGETPPAVISDVSTYSWLSVVQDAKDAGVSIDSWLANGHVWFSRLGVTAAMEMLSGKELPASVPVDLPMVPTEDVMKTDWKGIPADAVIASLLTNDQITKALAAN